MKIKPVNKAEIREKTKIFFRSQTWKNILVFFIFVALAFCFWMLQYFQQKMEYKVSIPVNYTHIPKELAITDSLPDKINLRLLDKGTVFLQYFFSKNHTPIEINLEKQKQEKKSYFIDKRTLETTIQDFLFPTTLLLTFHPETIHIPFSPLKKKQVPVIIDGTVSPAAGYMFSDSLQIEPASVWVYGDNKTLDTLQAIKTLIINRKNIQQKVDLSIRLVVPAHTRLSTEKVKIKAEVEGYTEKKFELPVICRKLPENIHVRFFPSSVEVVCQVALNKYAELTENELEVSVDYRTLTQGQSINAVLSLSQKPRGLVNYRIQPETVEYLIEQKKDL